MLDTINRNDLAAIAVMKKIVDRLSADKAAYDERVRTHNAQAQQISQMLNQYGIQQALAVRGRAHAAHSHQLQQYANAQFYNQPAFAVMPPWEAYITPQEFAVLEAWANGEDVLVHLLSRE